MSEWQEVLSTLKQPEYVHVLLNPLPVYGMTCGILGLIMALFLKSRQAQIVGLVIVVFASASVWPVMRFGHRGYDRVYSMSNTDGQQWLDAHEERAHDGQWVFYAAGLLALAAMFIPRRFPKATMPLVMATLIVSMVALATGGWISHAGSAGSRIELIDRAAKKCLKRRDVAMGPLAAHAAPGAAFDATQGEASPRAHREPAVAGHTRPAPALAKPAATSRAKVAPWLIPLGEVLVSAKIRPTSAAPKVCPTSRAAARMPLALPARSGGALARIVRLLGD